MNNMELAITDLRQLVKMRPSCLQYKFDLSETLSEVEQYNEAHESES